jgi:hypothetical protein
MCALRWEPPMLMRRRRISMSVEHRQESVSISQTLMTSVQASETSGESGVVGMSMMPPPPANCPSCGTAWHTPLQAALADGQIGAELLQAAVQDRRLHLQQQPDGQLWVCKQSLRELYPRPGGDKAQ